MLRADCAHWSFLPVSRSGAAVHASPGQQFSGIVLKKEFSDAKRSIDWGLPKQVSAPAARVFPPDSFGFRSSLRRPRVQQMWKHRLESAIWCNRI